MSAIPETVEWTCGECGVTGSWMADSENSGTPPPNWTVDGADIYCLACRRFLAGEIAVEEEVGETSRESREKLRKAAIIEFEILRAPDRNNGEIARSCRTSPRAVQNVRERLA